MNNCAKCEEQYREAEEKVQAEPNKYELKEKKECPCQHRHNPTRCSAGGCFLNGEKTCYINKDGKEVNEQGQEHHEVCQAGTSFGGSHQTSWTEFYKVKAGEVCDTCQKFIDDKLKDWEVKAKQKVKELCQKGIHNSGGWLFNDGTCQHELSWTSKEDCDCGKPVWENTFGDVKPCPTCNNIKNSVDWNQLERLFNELGIQKIERKDDHILIEVEAGKQNKMPSPEQQRQLLNALNSLGKSELKKSEIFQKLNKPQQESKGGCGTGCKTLIGAGIFVLTLATGLLAYSWLKGKKK